MKRSPAAAMAAALNMPLLPRSHWLVGRSLVTVAGADVPAGLMQTGCLRMLPFKCIEHTFFHSYVLFEVSS